MFRNLSTPFLVTLLAITALARAEDRFFDSDGVQICYVERGEAEGEDAPVILIHGFTRSTQLSWLDTGVMDALAERHRVIALDCRGHGKSDKPHEESAYGVNMVEDVVRLLDHFDIDRAHLIGYSMGGRIALKLAATHADRVESVTLVGSGGAIGNANQDLLDEVARSLDEGNGIRPLLLGIWPVGMPHDEELIRELNEQTLAANDAKALAAVARRFYEFGVSEEELSAIRAPVLSVIGDLDPLKANADALKERLPRLKLVVVTGASHLDILERPELREHVAAHVREGD